MKVVAVTSRFPQPIERGDKLRAQHQLRELARRHDVALVALSEGPVPAADREVVESLGIRTHVVERSRLTTVASTARGGLSGLPLQVGYFRSPQVEASVRRIVEAEQPDHLYCQLLRTAWVAEGAAVPCTIDYQDAFAAAMRRRSARQPMGIRRAFEFEAERIGRYEAEAFGLFKKHLVISDQDRWHLEVPEPDRVRVVPNGVDTEFFCPAETPERDMLDVAFVGNMGYPPNVRAAAFLAGEVMPRVRERRPGATLLLAGARPSRGVRRLAGPHVEVSGWLPDIRSAYRRARVMVAPLFIGAGLQNKVLEAMATGVPVVTTDLVNNAIGGVPGQELMVASTADEFADSTLALLDPDGPRDKMTAAASDMVGQRFTWKVVGEALSSILEEQ